MSIPLNVFDRYMTTFLDFWRLRPRRFLEVISEERSRYISPAQFLIVSLSLMLLLLVIMNLLIRRDLQAILGYEPPDPKALAGRAMVFMLSMAVLNALFYRFISPWWPIRCRRVLTEYFWFYCYMMAVYVPIAAVDVLVNPIVFSLVGSHGAPTWLLLLPGFLGAVFGILCFFLYLNPGIAYINRVSSIRMFLATLFWVVVISVPPSIVLGIIVLMTTG